MIITLVITLLLPKMISEIQKRKNAANITSPMSSIVTTDNLNLQGTKEVIYDDIDLTDTANTTYLSENVAYVCSKK